MTNEQKLFLETLSQKDELDVTGVNLNTVFKIAEEQNVLPLCYEKIRNAAGFDEENFPSVQRRVLSTVFSQTKRTNNFKKIYKVLTDKSFKPIVLKGFICRNLYGELCDHRPSGDEDVLIKKEDFFAVSKILEDNGYLCDEEVNEKMLSGKQEITFKNKNGLTIELHLNIFGTENSFRKTLNTFFENVFDNALSVKIDNQTFYALDYTEHYIYLFFHMMKHFEVTGVGMRQMLDMFKFGTFYKDEIDFERVNLAVNKMGAGKLYGDILEIGNTYLGFDLDNVFGKSFPEKLLDEIFSAGVFGHTSKERIGSKVKVAAAVASGGKQNRIRMIFPQLDSMREFYTVLYKHPYLLPVMWIVRMVRYVFRLSTGKTYNVLKSEEIANERIQLLKDYDII